MLIRSRQAEDAPALDLTPVIDMVFLLLIFFLVATTFQQEEREMRITLPFAASSGPISAALRDLVINVADDGSLIVAGCTISEDDLRRLVEDLVEANANQKVTVRGDRRTAYANVVKALDICKGAGIQEPYLDTVLGG